MDEVLLMAIDLGTSFIKVGVYDTQSNCVASSSEQVRGECPNPGIFIQYGDEIMQSVTACVKKTTELLGNRKKHIEAIVLTGQMAGFMGVDQELNDITTWSCSLDGRYLPFAEKMMKEYSGLILEQSGTNSPVMAPKIQWFEHEFPSESKKVVKYLMLSSYVLARLCDIECDDIPIDRTYLTWTGLADIRNGKWSEIACKEFGIDSKKLPNIVDSNRICGKLSGNIANECGLKSGIPVVAGAGDKPAGCLSAAVIEPGNTMLELSSYAGLSCCVKEFRPDLKERRVDTIPSAVPGEFYSHYYIAGSGITLDWFISNFTSENTQKREAFEIMDRKISGITPGSDGVISFGMLGGCALPFKGDLRGMFMNVNWSHKKEHLYRSLIESFSYEFSFTLDRICELYPDYCIHDIKITGGGAKSKVWTQMIADICRKKAKYLCREDTTLWGAAIIAGNAIGVFKDMKITAGQFDKTGEEFKPDAGTFENYKAYIKSYRRFVNYFCDFYNELQKTR